MNHPSIITPARINRRRVRHNPLTVAALAMGLVSAVLIAAIAIHLS